MRGDGVAIAVVALLALSCASEGGGKGQSTNDGFDRNALLGQIGQEIILPTTREFVTAAEALEGATQAWAVAAGGGDAGEQKAAAQQAWRAAMRVWQRLEVMAVGPAGSSLQRTGGQDLRDEIYSWPTVNPCRVDQETAEKGYESPTFFADELVNVYGLDAIEYLLFRPDSGNACPPQVSINADGTWAVLSAQEIEQRRAMYAAAAAGDAVKRARELRDAWEPEGGDFAGKLARAGVGESPYPSAQAALDEVFASMWYVERTVKDLKLAEPLGISPTCSAETCPEELESPWADHSLDNIAENLAALQLLMFGRSTAGVDGVGFDDWLVARGAPELAQELGADLQAAIDAMNAPEQSLRELMLANLDGARALHAAVKDVTDHLKTQFVAVLGLRVPDEGAGDND